MTIRPLQTDSYYQALGYTVRILLESDMHACWPACALAEEVRPPLMLNQFQLFCDHGQNLVGYVSWAWVNTAGVEWLLADTDPLPYREWCGGPHLYVADFVAPWGHARTITRLLRERPDYPGRWFGIRRTVVGSVRRTAGHVPVGQTHAS